MYLTGLHSIEESIKADRRGTLYTSSDVKNKRALKIILLAKQKKIPHKKVSLQELDRMGGKSHRKIIFATEALGKKSGSDSLQDILEKKSEQSIIVILDGVSDPHNLGAIIRSSDQFGVAAVVCPKDKSAKITPVASQSAAGADAYLPVFFETNLIRVVEMLQEKGYWVYAADMGGTPIQGATFSGKVAIILGAEGRGVGRLLGERADETLSIATMGHVDSLNVSVAAGVILYEVRKQLSVELYK